MAQNNIQKRLRDNTEKVILIKLSRVRCRKLPAGCSIHDLLERDSRSLRCIRGCYGEMCDRGARLM